jgi:hypothetical protein
MLRMADTGFSDRLLPFVHPSAREALCLNPKKQRPCPKTRPVLELLLVDPIEKEVSPAGGSHGNAT